MLEEARVALVKEATVSFHTNDEGERQNGASG